MTESVAGARRSRRLNGRNSGASFVHVHATDLHDEAA